MFGQRKIHNALYTLALSATLALPLTGLSPTAHALTASEAAQLGRDAGRQAGAAARGSANNASSEDFGVQIEGLSGDGTQSSYKLRQIRDLNTTCPSSGFGPMKGSQGILYQCTGPTNAPTVRLCRSNTSAPAKPDCSNGTVFDAGPLPLTNWQMVDDTDGKELEIRFLGCQGQNDCDFQFRESQSRSDTNSGIDQAANDALNDGLTDDESLVRDTFSTGVHTENGQTLLPGTSDNAGVTKSTILSSSAALEGCVERTKQSLDTGQAIFTCDQQEDVGTLGNGACESERVCLDQETRTTTWEERCETTQDISETNACSSEFRNFQCSLETPVTNIDCEVETTYEVIRDVNMPGCTQETLRANFTRFDNNLIPGEDRMRNNDEAQRLRAVESQIKRIANSSRPFKFLNNRPIGFSELGKDGSSFFWIDPRFFARGDMLMACDSVAPINLEPPSVSISGGRVKESCGFGCRQLILGVQEDNQLSGGSCSIRRFSATVTLGDINNIGKIIIKEAVSIDDHAQLRVRTPEGVRTFLSRTLPDSDCDIAPGFGSIRNINADITDFIKDTAGTGGWVKFDFFIAVGGKGEGAVKINFEPALFEVEEKTIDSCETKRPNPIPPLDI